MSVKAISPAAPVKSTPELDKPVAASVSGVKAAEPKNSQQVKETKEDTDQVKVTREDAENVAEVMNKVSELYNSQLNFEVFEGTDQLYVQIIDRNTKEVIKQIPPKEMLELSAKIKEMVGLILDKYA